MPNIISEDMIEQAAIKLLKEEYNYNVLNCFTTKKEDTNDNTGRENKRQVVLKDILYNRLCRINPEIPEDIIKENVQELSKINKFTDLMQINYENYQKIRYGINVEYKKDDKTENNRLMLIDFNNIENNNFTVASQMWIDGGMYWRRPDLIIFINGLPLVFIELKNSNIIIKNAYDKNLKDYLRDIPNLFNFNQICVLSNGLETRLGSFMAGYEHFFEWLKIESEKENPDRKSIKENAISLEYFLKGLCKPETLLDYIENFILFNNQRVKIIAKNHQYLGVNNLIESVKNREKLQGKLGVFWHTQGSGKTYSMVMFTRKVRRKINGNFVLLSRPSDSGHTPFGDIFLSESPDMIYWGKHRHVMGKSPEWWESVKIGGGAAPIETNEGWLLFYHGVTGTCNGYVYSIGGAILDIDNPSVVKYRCENFLLTPEEWYEERGFVPNVTFPCATIHDAATGRIAIYYGAADSYVGLAFTTADEVVAYIKNHSVVRENDSEIGRR